MGREAKMEQKVCDYAESLGFQQRKLAWIGRKDAPDRIFWRPASAGTPVRPFVIEFKDEGCEPRGGQVREVASLQSSGMPAYFCDNLEEGKKIIEFYNKHIEWGGAFENA